MEIPNAVPVMTLPSATLFPQALLPLYIFEPRYRQMLADMLRQDRMFTVAMQNGDRLEVDHPDALAIRDGMALFAGPGGIPSIFDHEGVSRVIGDLAGQAAEDA